MLNASVQRPARRASSRPLRGLVESASTTSTSASTPWDIAAKGFETSIFFVDL